MDDPGRRGHEAPGLRPEHLVSDHELGLACEHEERVHEVVVDMRVDTLEARSEAQFDDLELWQLGEDSVVALRALDVLAAFGPRATTPSTARVCPVRPAREPCRRGLHRVVHGAVQPAKDRLQRIAVVSLEHHQVPVPVDAVLGERDPIDAAAGLLEECRRGGTGLGEQGRLGLDDRDRDAGERRQRPRRLRPGGRRSRCGRRATRRETRQEGRRSSARR